MDSNILVIGSLNVDLTMRTDRIPAAGETFYGNRFTTGCGGKGANQTVACARLSSMNNAKMIGCVGDDEFGPKLINSLEQEGVDTSEIVVKHGVSTGVAIIMVEELSGQNRICLSEGANGAFSPSQVAKHAKSIKEASLIVLQLEIPVETVEEILIIANSANVPVLLNPAPARKLWKSIYEGVDYIVPNETEAEMLTGMKLDSIEDAKAVGMKFLEWGVKRAAIITLGETGIVVVTREKSVFLESYKVHRPIDTTAAGDCFVGGLAARLVEGESLIEAANFGQRAAAITVTRPGAQESIPRRDEVS